MKWCILNNCRLNNEDLQQRIRVEHMERQLANLTGLVHKALQAPVGVPGYPPHYRTPSQGFHFFIPLYYHTYNEMNKHRQIHSLFLKNMTINSQHMVLFMLPLDSSKETSIVSMKHSHFFGWQYWDFFGFPINGAFTTCTLKSHSSSRLWSLIFSQLGILLVLSLFNISYS